MNCRRHVLLPPTRSATAPHPLGWARSLPALGLGFNPTRVGGLTSARVGGLRPAHNLGLTPSGTRSSEHAPRRRAPGFTLVEIVITLSIVAMLIAMALGSTITLSHTRALEEPMSKVQEFAKKARNLAILEQRPYMVEIMPHSVALFSLVSTSGATAGVFGAAEAAAPKGRLDFYEFDPDVVLSVRRWRASEFAPPGRQIWVFERSGLCEPLAVRAESANGFIEVSFNALDAHVEDKASEIR
jgi:prepilin-type N-terminal cleavage/methylation domain-containing protein